MSDTNAADVLARELFIRSQGWAEWPTLEQFQADAPAIVEVIHDWALRTLAGTLGDFVDAHEAILRLTRDSAIAYDDYSPVVQRAIDRAEKWDAERRALDREARA